MKTKITFLSLILIISTVSFAQGTKMESRPVKNFKKFYQFDAKHKHFNVSKHHNSFVLSYKGQLKSNFNNRSKVDRSDIQSLDSLISYHWDVTGNEWKNSFKYEFEYNDNGNETLMISYEMDTTSNQWSNSWKDEFTYNDNGNLTLDIYYEWDSFENEWVNSEKDEYTYDSTGKLILKLYYNWDQDAGEWNNSDKDEYTYDSTGYLTLLTSYYWDFNISDWVVLGKVEYSYDSEGNLGSEIYYGWDTYYDQWVIYSKYEYTYDSDGNLELEIDYDWDPDSNQWMESYKMELTYDSNGNRTLETDYDWDWDLNQWVNSYKEELTFDTSVNISDLFVPPYITELGNNKFLEIYNYDWDDIYNNWVSLQHIVAYYSDYIIGVNELSDKNNAEIYPNPVSGELNVILNENNGNAVFELFDLQGKKLMTQEVSAKTQINLEHLVPGMYLYTITVGDNRKSGKLIKR